ncbi:hypothetical protein BC332_34715 [Capsicum chinense]|nr:hypothetical protein BC332_34715 [Capsicum chinense]
MMREDFNPEHQSKCHVLGLAEVGTVCAENSGCAVVQDNGLSAAFSIAHEIGHLGKQVLKGLVRFYNLCRQELLRTLNLITASPTFQVTPCHCIMNSLFVKHYKQNQA